MAIIHLTYCKQFRFAWWNKNAKSLSQEEEEKGFTEDYTVHQRGFNFYMSLINLL